VIIMAATQAGANSLDLYNHWSRILNNYMGKAVNHIKVTKVLDPNGNIIDESQVETTIYGAISPVKTDAINESAGLLQYGDLVAYFLHEAGVLVGTQTSADGVRLDMIEYQGKMYTVQNIQTTAYDAGSAVLDKFILRLVADE